MDQEEHSPTLNKILAAISGLLRSNPEAQAAFDKLDGLSVLLRRMIDSPEPRFQTSAAFMLSRICTQNKIFSNYLANMGFVHHFVALLHQEPIPDQLREHLTEVLSVVLRNSEEARKDAAQGSLQLRPMLEARKTAVAGREESADEAEYIDGILELLGSEERQRSSGERWFDGQSQGRLFIGRWSLGDDFSLVDCVYSGTMDVGCWGGAIMSAFSNLRFLLARWMVFLWIVELRCTAMGEDNALIVPDVFFGLWKRTP